MRRAHVLPGGKWPPHMGFSSRMGSKLDRNASELVDFDKGGTWAPSSPICIGGVATILDSACQITGGITTKPGYGGKKPQIELVDQWPLFSAPRAKTTVVPWTRSDGYGFKPVFFNRNGSIVRTKKAGDGIETGMILADHHLHDGATLVRVTSSARFTGAKPAAIGQETLTIFRIARATDVAAAGMHTAGTVGATTYAADYGYRVCATVEDFYNGGNANALVYEPDRNNVIDKATYYYAFVYSTNIDAEAFSLKLEYTVPSMKWE